MKNTLLRPIGLLEKISYTILISAMISFGIYGLVEIFSNFSSQWYWLIIASAYTLIINETFTHRVCAHKTFSVDVNSLTFKILTWLSSVDQAYGPARQHAILHSLHHVYSDQRNRDPINIRQFWWGAAISSPLSHWGEVNPPHIGKIFEIAHKDAKDILDDKWVVFCERYSIVISLTTQIALFFIAPVLLFKVVLPGRALMTFFMILDGFCHLRGFPFNYRNANTRDESSNNLVLHYLLLGLFNGMMENNHHAWQNDFKANRHWYEIDTLLPVLYLFRYLMGKNPATTA